MTTASLAKLAARGDIGPDERVVLVITGEGLKTLDAVRGTFDEYEIDASSTSSSARSSAGGAGVSVIVKLPTQLRDAAGGAATVEVEGATVGDVLDALFEQHGELRDRLTTRAAACGAS